LDELDISAHVKQPTNRIANSLFTLQMYGILKFSDYLPNNKEIQKSLAVDLKLIKHYEQIDLELYRRLKSGSLREDLNSATNDLSKLII
jgi:hypothetical protein